MLECGSSAMLYCVDVHTVLPQAFVSIKFLQGKKYVLKILSEVEMSLHLNSRV